MFAVQNDGDDYGDCHDNSCSWNACGGRFKS